MTGSQITVRIVVTARGCVGISECRKVLKQKYIYIYNRERERAEGRELYSPPLDYLLASVFGQTCLMHWWAQI